MDNSGPVKSVRVTLGKGHRLVTNAFSSYGALAARRPWLLSLLGAVILGASIFGLFNAETENRLEELFVRTDSRVAKERDFYNSKYGGFIRKEVFSVSDPAGKAAYSRANLAALAAGMAPFLSEDEAAFNGTVRNPTQTAMLANVQGSSRRMSEADFCERPQVPPVFAPSLPGVPYFAQGNFISVGYQFLTTCLPTKTVAGSPLNGLPLATLPTGWGIDRFPCTKVSPLDCFQEGGLDYPGALRLLEQRGAGPTVPLSLVDIVFAHPGKAACIQDFATKVQTDLTAALGPAGAARATITAAQVAKALNDTTLLFSSWGYRWRPSFRTMTDAQILAHLNTAYANGVAGVTVSQCIQGNRPCCLGWEATHLPLTVGLGGIKRNATGAFEEIASIRVVANNFNPEHPQWIDQMNAKFGRATSAKERRSLVENWDERLVDTWKPMYEGAQGSGFAPGEIFNGSTVGFTTWTAVENVLKDAGHLDPWTVAPAVILVILYIIAATINVFRPVHSHVHLGLAGLGIISVSIIAGVGLTAGFGVKLSPLAQTVAPLLALGIGFNDMFVLGKALKNFVRQRAGRSFEDEMRLTVGLAGPSVCLTMLSIAASFGIAAASPYPGVSWFCIQMCITILLELVGLLLLFVPLMGLDARRAKAGKVDPFLRFVPLHLLVGGGRNSAPADATPNDDLEVAKGALAKPPKAEIDAGGWIPRLVRKTYAPLFDSKLFALAVVAFAAAFFVAMAVLAFTQSESDLLLTDVTRRGTFQHDYAHKSHDDFESWDVAYINKEIDYPAQQANILGTIQAFQRSPWVEQTLKIFETAWLAASPKSVLFNAQNAGLVPTAFTPLPAAAFYPFFQQDYVQRGAQSILQSYHCKNLTTQTHVDCRRMDANTRLDATAMTIYVNGLTSTDRYRTALRDLRAIADARSAQSGNTGGFVYGYIAVLYDQFEHIERQTFFIVGLTLVGVFVTSVLFQWSLLLSLLVTALLLVIDIELYGFFWIMTGKLNALTLVNLAVAVGLATEYTFHLSRNYLVFEGTRHHRVAKALEWTLEPLLHGMAAFFLAIFALAFAKYRAFQLYYFGFFAVLLVIAAFNGFVLLPVILRFLGPPSIFNNTASGIAASAPADTADKPAHLEMEGGRKAAPPIGSDLER
ncbi:putative Patched family protein [Klebsormidium nitens]|uniref:Putative Patched family protein n=1 Tax=Klebsormidium nitens TaxID=105231 RepID=A0A1Y1IK89_KLENI|nr:putative Patched family protein [Klebsormidium nitens]|eukprot:GAQ91285.1 putative Patched family protein [Klebsormidium nitens]